MFIHSVVFIAQIESVFVSEKNPFRRKTVPSSPILAKNDAESEYKLKRVVNKRVSTKKKNAQKILIFDTLKKLRFKEKQMNELITFTKRIRFGS